MTCSPLWSRWHLSIDIERYALDRYNNAAKYVMYKQTLARTLRTYRSPSTDMGGVKQDEITGSATSFLSKRIKVKSRGCCHMLRRGYIHTKPLETGDIWIAGGHCRIVFLGCMITCGEIVSKRIALRISRVVIF